jgi:hypothetical protein
MSKTRPSKTENEDTEIFVPKLMFFFKGLIALVLLAAIFRIFFYQVFLEVVDSSIILTTEQVQSLPLEIQSKIKQRLVCTRIFVDEKWSEISKPYTQFDVIRMQECIDNEKYRSKHQEDEEKFNQELNLKLNEQVNAAKAVVTGIQ